MNLEGEPHRHCRNIESMLQAKWPDRTMNVGGSWMTGFARLVFASLLALTAGAVASSDGRCDELLKAKLGVLRLSSSAPVFIAQDKGYFRDAGLDIELKFFDAAQPIAVATTSGDIDFGITAFTAGLYNLAGKGTLKAIGGM